MDATLESICKSLDTLSNAVVSAWGDDRILTEVHGWHHPPLNRHELAKIPKHISIQIKEHGQGIVDDSLVPILKTIPGKITALQKSVIPQMFSGNGNLAIPAYVTTLFWILQTLHPILSWTTIDDVNLMPAKMARKLRSINASIDQLIPNMGKIEEQIDIIENATSAAESLPTDLEALKEAREKIASFVSESTSNIQKLNSLLSESKKATDEIQGHHTETQKLVTSCEEAYRITTTKGLAAAFDQRAKKLGWTLAFWVFGLIGALTCGGIVGSYRVELLIKSVAAENQQWNTILMQIVLSAISVGAPLWFAWLATKQIGQRFRLAEDYAFKASVAKAYEGYRKEAARIDESFEARLFSSALTRLEEPPLRLVESSTPGAPWSEFIETDAFKNALDILPDLKNTFAFFSKKIAPNFKFNFAKTIIDRTQDAVTEEKHPPAA